MSTKLWVQFQLQGELYPKQIRFILGIPDCLLSHLFLLSINSFMRKLLVKWHYLSQPMLDILKYYLHFIYFSGHGTLLGRVRCGDNDIMCLSWCPIPSDVIYDKPGNKPKYLVAGTKDYGVFIVNTNSTSKAKNDCAQLTANIHLPRSPMNKNQRFSK